MAIKCIGYGGKGSDGNLGGSGVFYEDKGIAKEFIEYLDRRNPENSPHKIVRVLIDDEVEGE